MNILYSLGAVALSTLVGYVLYVLGHSKGRKVNEKVLELATDRARLETKTANTEYIRKAAKATGGKATAIIKESEKERDDNLIQLNKVNKELREITSKYGGS